MSVDSFLTPDGAFVFTLTSNGYKFMTLNLLTHLRRIKVPWKLCIVCADSGSYSFFRKEGIPCIRCDTPLPDFGTEASPFGTKQFQTLNLKKLELLHSFSATPAIRYGVYMDGDIAVYSDFLPDIISRFQAPGSSIYLQCDERTRVDCSGNPGCLNGCTGFLAWRHGVDTSIFKVDRELWKSRPEDQMFVNTMMGRLGIPVVTLPRSLYPNGAFASLYGNGSARKSETHLLHYNYLVGASKQKKMKNNGDWLIPY